jgi:D-cysteine desulfhydrase
MNLNEKLSLAILPTPIRKLENLSKEYGFDLYVKMDDLTHFLASGNKIRKLEYLLKDAKDKNSDIVFTCGGVQSNHCRATAVLSKSLGMQPVLFLRGSEPEIFNGNLLIDMLIGSEIVYVTPEQYKNIDEIFKEYSKKYESEGKKVYIIPEGGSNSLGALGYVNAVFELDKQVDLDQFDAVCCALGSGGTVAGLIAGLNLVDKPCRVIGFNVTKTDKDEFTEKIFKLLNGMSEFDVDLKLEKVRMEVIDDFSGPAYAVPTFEDLELIKHVAELETLILDPVYTSKALRGTIETFKNSGKKVIFIHTGGTFGLFAQAEKITQIMR